MLWFYLHYKSNINQVFNDEVYFSRNFIVNANSSNRPDVDAPNSTFKTIDLKTNQVDYQTYEIIWPNNTIPEIVDYIPQLFATQIRNEGHYVSSSYRYFKPIRIDTIYPSHTARNGNLKPQYKITLKEDVLYRLITLFNFNYNDGFFDNKRIDLVRRREAAPTPSEIDWSKWEDDVKVLPSQINTTKLVVYSSYKQYGATGLEYPIKGLWFRSSTSHGASIQQVIVTSTYHILKRKIDNVNKSNSFFIMVPCVSLNTDDSRQLMNSYVGFASQKFGTSTDIKYQGFFWEDSIYSKTSVEMGTWKNNQWEYIGTWVLPYTHLLYDARYNSIYNKKEFYYVEIEGETTTSPLQWGIRLFDQTLMLDMNYIKDNLYNIYFDNINWLNNTNIKHLSSKTDPWITFNGDFYLCSKEYGCSLINTKLPSISNSFVEQEFAMRNAYNTSLWTNERNRRERNLVLEHSLLSPSGITSQLMSFGANYRREHNELMLDYLSTRDMLKAQRQDIINSQSSSFLPYEASNIIFHNWWKTLDIDYIKPRFMTRPVGSNNTQIVGNYDVQDSLSVIVQNDSIDVVNKDKYRKYYQIPRIPQKLYVSDANNEWWKIEGSDWITYYKNLNTYMLSKEDIRYIKDKLEKGVFIYNPNVEPIRMLHNDDDYERIVGENREREKKENNNNDQDLQTHNRPSKT